MSGRKYRTLESALELLDSAVGTLVPPEDIKAALVTVREEIATREQAWENLHYRLYGAGCKPGGTPPWMRAGRQRESK